MINTDKQELPDWVQYIAQDADGQWWAYQTEPNLSHISWYENEVGQILKLEKDAPNPDWQTSLQKVT